MSYPLANFHFILLASRLGLINKPHKQDAANLGVEQGSDFLARYLSDFGEAFARYEFTQPEAITDTDKLQLIAEEYAAAAQSINSKVNNAHGLAFLGGDHSIGFISYLVLQKLVDLSKVLHIQIDSHTDIHLAATSPSGNFHGMWVRPWLTEFDHSTINNLVHSRLAPQHVMYLGNLDCEPAEITYLEQVNIFRTKNPIELINNIEQVIPQIDHIHLSFDVDAMSSQLCPATGMPNPSGLDWIDIEPILKFVAGFPSFSLDLVEVNPVKSGATTTAKFCQKLLQSLYLQ